MGNDMFHAEENHDNDFFDWDGFFLAENLNLEDLDNTI